MKRAFIQKKQTKPPYGTARMGGGLLGGRSRGALDEKIFSIFQPDILAVSQFFQHTHRKHPIEPEKKLMLAVLQDAVDCFQKYLFSRNEKGKTTFRDAEEWILERNSEWLFSFESICESLGLDAGYIRNGLIEWNRRAVSLGGKSARIYHLSHRRKQAAPPKAKNIRSLKVAGI